MKEFGAGIKGGFVGAILMLIIVIGVVVWWKPFDYQAVVIVEQTRFTNDNDQMLTSPEVELMSSLRDKGVLLTPTEYTNNIIGYYNTLIAFLAIFFVVFTVAGYFAIRNMSKKEVRDEAREILQDSIRFKEDVLSVLRGEFDGEYLSHEDYDEQLQSMQEDISSIKGGILETIETKIQKNGTYRNAQETDSEGKC